MLLLGLSLSLRPGFKVNSSNYRNFWL